LSALGLDEKQAQASVELFREHDEQLLRDQHLVYDDDVALRQTTREAYAELQGLIEADNAARAEAAAEDAATADASSAAPPPAH
jgi:glutathione-regulated potassium-efflux system protein KefB